MRVGRLVSWPADPPYVPRGFVSNPTPTKPAYAAPGIALDFVVCPPRRHLRTRETGQMAICQSPAIVWEVRSPSEESPAAQRSGQHQDTRLLPHVKYFAV